MCGIETAARSFSVTLFDSRWGEQLFAARDQALNIFGAEAETLQATSLRLDWEIKWAAFEGPPGLVLFSAIANAEEIIGSSVAY